jgi:glucokinase
MYLGIEIGGTKLQLGVGPGDGAPLAAIERSPVERSAGAEAIRAQIETFGRDLCARFDISAVGIGFGGPLDSRTGTTLKSHHVSGWDQFPLAAWAREKLGGRPVAVENDADTAGLAEALFGAGRGCDPVLYLTVGTGIGGGLIHAGKIYRGRGLGATEIGHLRPGLTCEGPEEILESFAAGWGIEAFAQAAVEEPVSHRIGKLGKEKLDAEAIRQQLIDAEERHERDVGDLLDRAQGAVDKITVKLLADAVIDGNALASEIFQRAWRALGWGIGQAITLLAPEVVVIGGGVSLIGNARFFDPLREEIARYVFPPFRDAYQVVPAALGEEVVVHGALALARSL